MLKSIDVGATNMTFKTKGEIESNFLSTPPEQPKIDQRVNSTLNLMGFNLSPPVGVFKK